MIAGLALLALPLLALLLLGAHFVHAGLWPVAALCVALVALLWVRRPWAARTLQVVLAVGAIEWILTAAMLARMRMSHEQPYVRMLVILGGVAVFTLAAAAAIQHPRLARRFGLGARAPTDT
ncbi:MAG TPA: hypothetical protein VF277_06090 [Steroidobacteraceae bacterium]